MKEPESRLTATLPKTDLTRVVIIGGGFAGIELVRKLRKINIEVVMIDKNNYHSFIPLLYQVATAGLSPGDISSPLREFLQDDPHFHFRLAHAETINSRENSVVTDRGSIFYDYLVIGTGSATNFFGNGKIEKNALRLREINDAIKLRNKLIDNFEEALLVDDNEERQKLLNVAIVGAGPTGVELAGAIGELRRHILPKDYPELDFSKMRIYLIEGLDSVLPAMSEEAGRKAKKYLEGFGVEVILGKMVKDVENGNIQLDDDTVIQSKSLIWAAGVKGNIIKGLHDEAYEKSRILVNEFNQVIGYNNIFAIGDVAAQKSDKNPNGLPMLAPVAIQQAKHLGENFKIGLDTSKWKPFSYVDKGTMATIGRNKAVVDTSFKLKIGGFIGWFIWMFVHLFSIIGFRRKMMVFANWVWNYFTYNRGKRLIIERKEA